MIVNLIIDGEEKKFKAKKDEDGFLHLINDDMTITFGGIDDVEKLLRAFEH